MRCLFACFVAGCLLSSAPAKGDENEVEKMKAELKALREENKKLKEMVKYMREQFQELPKISEEQAKLDGVWVIESATCNGKDISSDKGGVVEFQGNRVTARLPGSKNPIRLELGLSPSARGIYFFNLHDAPAGPPTNTSFDYSNGSYELKGDTLRIGLLCYGRATTTSDKNQPLWVLKRKKP